MSITLLLIIITGWISYQAFQREDFFSKLKHWPYAEKRNSEYSRLLTGILIHGDMVHLLFNLFALYSFGTLVELHFGGLFGSLQGRLYYLILYLLSGLIANLMTYHKYQDHAGWASVGASGSVSGVMFAFIVFEPWSQLLLFFIIPIPGVLAAILYLVYSSYAAKKGHGMIDHVAHFWGAVTGFILTILFKPSLLNYFIQEIIAKLN
jgi:membrane associated rhomboid family serine protease